MAYIRTDRNCNAVTQPGKLVVVDTFGNSNDFFHVDYVRTDRTCTANPIPFDPNNPQNTVHDNPDVLFFDTDWTRRLVDNSAGAKFQYVDSPRTSGIVDNYVPPEIVMLATEEDSDLVISDEAGDDILEVAYTGTLTSVLN